MGETGKPQKALRPNEVAMDVKTFVIELLSALGELDFVQDIDLQVEGLVISGRIALKEDRFLETYFNESTETIAFALVGQGKRLWGIDRDKIRGWHMHPLGKSKEHVAIRSLSVVEITQELTKVWKDLP